MKEARFSDYQRRLRSRAASWQTKLERFTFSEIPTLGSGEFLFQSAITALCGPNGVGKTTLLAALSETLNPTVGRIAKKATTLVSGRASLSLTQGDQSVVAEVEFTQEGTKPVVSCPAQVISIDSAFESGRYQSQFQSFDSVDDIINGVGGRVIDQASLQEIGYLVCRDYRSVTMFEVELNGIAPFFEVAYGDDRYDSRTMGSGEIAALHLWWALSNISSGQIALLEEPEAFLSHNCQVNVAKHIIAKAVERRFCVVTSTHSAPLINLLPETSLKFFVRGRTGLASVPDQPHPAVLKSVGIDPPLLVVALVEDQAASDFAKAIVERIEPSFARQIRFEIRDGESNISADLKNVSFFGGPPFFVGLYDGDQRQLSPKELADVTAFLPESESIEAVFRKMIQNNVSELQVALGKDDLDIVLRSLEGVDAHDWFRRLADEVGISRSQIFPVLFSLWIKKEGSLDAAIGTCMRLKEICASKQQRLV